MPGRHTGYGNHQPMSSALGQAHPSASFFQEDLHPPTRFRALVEYWLLVLANLRQIVSGELALLARLLDQFLQPSVAILKSRGGG